MLHERKVSAQAHAALREGFLLLGIDAGGEDTHGDTHARTEQAHNQPISSIVVTRTIFHLCKLPSHPLPYLNYLLWLKKKVFRPLSNSL
jgi:hypothetical protein